MNAPIMPQELVAKAELAQAIATIGQLLPQGIASVTFYRPSPDHNDRVAVEVVDWDMHLTRHWADQVSN